MRQGTTNTLLMGAALMAFMMLTGCAHHDNKSPATNAMAASGARKVEAATPIKHLVVIYQENVSFDHYFATYPHAANPQGEPVFVAKADTPGQIDTLQNAGLLTNNPNKTNPANGDSAADPFRLDRSQAATSDQHHEYEKEQAAFNGGGMDLFPKYTGRASKGGVGSFGTNGQVMGYFDGNTVTALWNYAQAYALHDNFFTTTFGPSTPGHINLISGQTNGVILPKGAKLDADGTYDGKRAVPDGNGGWTMIGDFDPHGDVCVQYATGSMKGRNIGDMLNAANVSWGWFQGGFDLTRTNPDGSTGCQRGHMSPYTHVYSHDYSPHHDPFQYYASTSNLTHKRPSSIAAIGSNEDGGANHQYDLEDFFAALKAGNMPAVSFLKADAYQDGHAGYSSPLDEQAFLVRAVNAIQQSPFWKDTAILIAYDDSDGWYDHAHNVVHPSRIPLPGYDVFDGDHCGPSDKTPLPGVDGKPAQGRCGYGTRLPFLVISPYARQNYVAHGLADQTSIMRFIEDNWLDGKRLGQGSFDARANSINDMFDWKGAHAPKLILDPATGLPQGNK